MRIAGRGLAVQEAFAAAATLGVILQQFDVHGPADFDEAFAAMIKGRAEAVVVVQSTIFNTPPYRIAQLAASHRLPAVYGSRITADDGGLMSYGPNNRDSYLYAAAFVDKILKGAKPRDLPVEQPRKFELAINLKTAKALGLTIPQSLLLRADEVIQQRNCSGWLAGSRPSPQLTVCFVEARPSATGRKPSLTTDRSRPTTDIHRIRS